MLAPQVLEKMSGAVTHTLGPTNLTPKVYSEGGENTIPAHPAMTKFFRFERERDFLLNRRKDHGGKKGEGSQSPKG
jgi:hypothetical protein